MTNSGASYPSRRHYRRAGGCPTSGSRIVLNCVPLAGLEGLVPVRLGQCVALRGQLTEERIVYN